VVPAVAQELRDAAAEDRKRREAERTSSHVGRLGGPTLTVMLNPMTVALYQRFDTPGIAPRERFEHWRSWYSQAVDAPTAYVVSEADHSVAPIDVATNTPGDSDRGRPESAGSRSHTGRQDGVRRQRE
jgi:hypothetical protein